MEKRFNCVRLTGLFILGLTLSACSTTPKTSVSNEPLPHSWMNEVVSYKEKLNSDHPDQLKSIYAVSDTMRNDVFNRFGDMPKHAAAEKLARWLIDENGYGMTYNLNANFSPIDAYENKQGNCLTFTMLLITLAAELDIEIEYNEVDIPNIWNMNEQGEMMLYRHVNALYTNIKKKSVFDLAIQDFDFGYPQRVISQQLAAAKLLSNRAINSREEKNFSAALHSIFMAISMAPSDSNLWVNLGSVYRSSGDVLRAEQSFQYALSLSQNNPLAASNLERLYRKQGQFEKSEKYARMSKRSRHSNPYFHYEKAKIYYASKNLKAARKAIGRAKQLHESDPRFYELSSRIAQYQQRYSLAMRDLRTAFKLSVDERSRGRYAYKAEMVSRMVHSRNRKRDNVNNHNSLNHVRGG